MKIHESMNVSLLHKKLVFLLLTALLWFGYGGLTAQTPGLDVYYPVVLKNGTYQYNFQHFQVNQAPKIEQLPAHGTAFFNPSSCCNGNGRFGIKGYPADNQINYVPNPNFIGRDTFVVYYYRNLGNGNSIGAYKVFNVLVVPSYLYAENDYVSTLAGQSIEIDVLANDYGNGTNLTIAEIPNVNHGTATRINGNTKILFNPASGFKGVAHLNYTICDAQGSCDMATVSICVLDNTPPVYDSIFVTTKKNTPQVILLPLGSNYTMILPPSHGALDTLETLTYVPNLNYVGYDKVIFEDTVSNRVRVFEIRVLNAPGSNVFLFDDVVYTPKDEVIEEINLLANDNGGAYLANVSIVGGNTTLHGGTLNYLAKGVYRYTPPAGFQGIDKFTYKATPPNSGAWEYATCYIVVSNQNPLKPVFHITTPKNTPLVLGDHLPFTAYEYTNYNNAASGVVTFHPGYQTVSSIHGQTFSGTNMLVYNPNVNAVGTDEFEFNYCPGGQTSNCPLVKVIVDVIEISNPQQDTICAGGECVWSGDANHDGSVDVRDILPIGLYMGEVGETRPNGSINWYGQYSDNWNSLFGLPLGFNAKHIDTDGNGIVSSLDTAAIRQFYGKYHNLTPEPVPAIKELPFYIEEPDFNNVQPGDILYAPIHLGNDTIPAMDAYGLTFGLDFDPTLFESVRVIFNESSWMSYNSPILSMTHNPLSGKIDAGYTRTSGISASGYGVIGVAEFIVIDDISGNKLNSNSTTVNLRPMGIMNGSGQTFGLNGNSITFHFNLNGDNRNQVNDEQLVVFPNPASNLVNIHLNGLGNEIERLVLYNVMGQAVYDSGTMLAKRTQVDVSRLAQGVYMVKAWSKGNVLNGKIEVLKK